MSVNASFVSTSILRLDPSFDADLILLLIGFLMVTDFGAGSGYLVAKELTKPPVTQRLLARLPGRS